jgi:hypothetical protein
LNKVCFNHYCLNTMPCYSICQYVVHAVFIHVY